MIASYDRLEWMPIEQWQGVYRFIDERYNKVDTRTLATIRPLTDESAVRLAEWHDFGHLAYLAERNALPDEWEVQSIDESDLEVTRAWLRQRRPGALDDVYVEWRVPGGCAAIVAWTTLCECFDDFWYPFEKMLVSDDTQDWRILFGPNDHVRWRGQHRR